MLCISIILKNKKRREMGKWMLDLPTEADKDQALAPLK